MGATALTWPLGEASQYGDITPRWEMHPIVTSSSLSLTSAHTQIPGYSSISLSQSPGMFANSCAGASHVYGARAASLGGNWCQPAEHWGCRQARLQPAAGEAQVPHYSSVPFGLCAGLANSLVPTTGDGGPEHRGAGAAEEGAGTCCPGWAQLFYATRGAGHPSALPGPGKGVAEEEPVLGGAAG